MMASVNELKTSKKTLDRKLRRHMIRSCLLATFATAAKIGKQMGVRWSYLMKCSSLKEPNENKSRSDAIPQETVTKVKDYFLHPDVSTPLPHKNKVDKDGKPRHIMTKRLKEAYANFKNFNKSTKVVFSKFATMRPKHMKVHSNERMKQCLCEYCLTVELKIKTLKAVLNTEGVCLKNKYDIINSSMCAKQGPYHRRECIERQCKHCGVLNIREMITQKDCKNKVVDWNVWGNLPNGKKEKGLLRKKSFDVCRRTM